MLHPKEKDLFEMRLSLRALVGTMVILCSALYSVQLSAHEHPQDQNQARTPRTQGVEPDFLTRMKLTEIADRYAHLAGIPAELVRAVVRVESDWDSELTGFAGEIGLMQIRPETARDMGFIGNDADLYDPERNIRWGVAYLAVGYKLASGDLCQTVLKYNSGHQAEKMTDAATAYCGRVRNILASAN
jgi:soluble lytic murein transglycosylase-like protein